MSAGEWNRSIVIEAQANTDDGAGGQVDSWVDVATLWASVVPISGSQLLRAGLLNTEITHRIGCAYRVDVLTERRAMRARLPDGGYLAIKAVRDVGGQHIALECDAVTQAGATV